MNPSTPALVAGSVSGGASPYVPTPMRRLAWHRTPGTVRIDSSPYFASVTLIGSGVAAGTTERDAASVGLAPGGATLGWAAQAVASGANSASARADPRQLERNTGNSG